jgi:hypothetical protein
MRSLTWGVLVSVGLTWGGSTSGGISSGFVQSAGAQTPSTQPAFEALIAQLAHEDAARRDAAQAALLQADDQIIDALARARQSAADPDVQLRLDTLIAQVQERIDIGPSRITLRYVDAPLNVVLDDLARQSRGSFSDLVGEFGNLESVPRLSVNVVDVSFWKALEEIQTASNVIFMPQPNGWRAMNNFGQVSHVRGAECGAFLVQPQTASYQRSVSYARNVGTGGEHFSLQFQMLAEPKIRLAASTGVLQVDRAVDSNGNDLLAAQQTQQIGTSGQNAIPCVVMLKYPENPGDKIAEVSGTMRLSMARRVETIASDDLMGKGAKGVIDGVRLAIDAQPLDGPQRGQISINIVIEADGDNGTLMATRLQQGLYNQLKVTDGRGMPLLITQGPNLNATNPARIEMRVTFNSRQPQESAGPYKLRLDLPTSFREVEVPFTFGDLKMP